MKQLILLILLALSLSAGAQTTYYIKEGGTGTKTGSTWEDASDNLQGMINNATSGDYVYVAAGTYTGGFVMKEGVTVLGGFPNNATATLADRKLPGTGENLTILDGMSQTRVLTQEKGFAAETLWEGFVIQNGNASGVGTIVYHNSNTTVLAGIVFAYDATGIAKMIALEESGKLAWGPRPDEIGAANLADGAKNWTTIENYISNNSKQWTDYPVWKYIKELRETTKPGGYADWYLPAIQELEEVYAQRNILNVILKGIGKSELQNDFYWSGSENNSNNAWSVNCSNGYVNGNAKDYDFHARAVRALSLNDLTISQGGGVYLMQAGVLRNSMIKNCQASTGGGAYLSSKARLEGCVVERCVAKEASAVYVGENATLLSSTVVNNNVDHTPQYDSNAKAFPKIGDFYSINGTWGTSAANAIGIVCYINPNNPYSGYILHKDETSENWNLCKSWAEGKGDGWKLPAIDVLQSIYSNKVELNTQINKIGGTGLSDNYYWSGSENVSYYAWGVNFSNGFVNSYNKNNAYRARAVRAF